MYRKWPLFGFIFLSFFVDLESQMRQAIQIVVERSRDRSSVGSTLEINSTFSALPSDSDSFLQAQYTYIKSDSEKYDIVSVCSCRGASDCSVSKKFEDRMSFRCEKGSDTWEMQLYINTTNEDINSSLLIFANYIEPDVKSNRSVELNVSTCPSQEPAEPDNSTLCTYNHFNCPTQFYCRDPYVPQTVSSVCLADATWNASIFCTMEFECDWSGEPIPPILLRAVGAPAEFNVVNNNPLFNGTLFTWKLNTSTTIAELVYISEPSPGSFLVHGVTQFGADARSIATDTTSNHTLIFTPTNLIHNEGLITLERDGCSSESMISNSTKLDLTYGNTTHFGSEFVPNNTKVEYKDIVMFDCNETYYEPQNFTAVLLEDATWEPSTPPITCVSSQEGLKDGQIAGISFIIIYVIASGVWIYFLIGRKKDKEISMTKVFILGGCKFICWIIGIALLFGTTDDTCNLTGGNIAGIVLDVLAVSMAVIFCFLVRKQFFDVRPPTAQSRVSPASVPQNGEDSPEHMEMKQDQNEDL